MSEGNVPTKLKISEPSVGDGMGDMGMENTPPPSQMGSDLPMQEPPMDGMPQEDDEGMGPQEPPMESPQGGGDDDELMSVIDSLSMEDKAAVLKYAKSMADDGNNGQGIEPQEGNIPESRQRLMKEKLSPSNRDDSEKVKRDSNELPKKYRKRNNPFVSPF